MCLNILTCKCVVHIKPKEFDFIQVQAPVHENPARNLKQICAVPSSIQILYH